MSEAYQERMADVSETKDVTTNFQDIIQDSLFHICGLSLPLNLWHLQLLLVTYNLVFQTAFLYIHW